MTTLGDDGLQLRQEISRGATSTVYLATASDGADVAVKVLTDNQPVRFRREVEALRRVAAHRNTVSLLDHGWTNDGHPYLVMEYHPRTLADELSPTGEMSWKTALTWLLPVADALSFAHAEGVLHKDVKPSNILIDADGAPRLADFGIAAVSGTDETVTPQLTYHYAAPEALGDDPSQLDERTDLYGLGATLDDLVLPYASSRRPHMRPPRPKRTDRIRSVRPALDEGHSGGSQGSLRISSRLRYRR